MRRTIRATASPSPATDRRAAGVLLRLLKTGLLAGFLTAIVYTAVQSVTVTPLILEAETYENATPGHSHGAAVRPAAGDAVLILAHGHAEPAATSDHGDHGGGWAPADGAARLFFTFLANLVAGVGFALLLAAGMALRGKPVDARLGLLWGLAGFAACSLAPALGLPPEVPGAAVADLTARQTWWLATAAATAGGIALIAFAPRWPLRALGAVALLAPHLVGAPHAPAGAQGAVPPELASHFVVWSLATAALFWALLGTTCGALYRRFS
jgi:cobalt transporter subunit CbtA